MLERLDEKLKELRSLIESDEDLRALERAVAASPSDGAAQARYASALLRAGRKDEVGKLLVKSGKLAPVAAAFGPQMQEALSETLSGHLRLHDWIKPSQYHPDPYFQKGFIAIPLGRAVILDNTSVLNPSGVATMAEHHLKYKSEDPAVKKLLDQGWNLTSESADGPLEDYSEQEEEGYEVTIVLVEANHKLTPELVQELLGQ